MVFKINISHKGKTYKVETENEFLVGKKIGETVDGGKVDDSLKGFVLIITGASDLSGIPGFKGLEGSGYHRRLLTYGSGMKDRRKGMRLRKTNRGEEISLKTHQVNIKVIKEGEGKFSELVGKKEGGSGEESHPPAQEKEEVKEEEGSSEGGEAEKSEEKGEENISNNKKGERGAEVSESNSIEGNNQEAQKLEDTENQKFSVSRTSNEQEVQDTNKKEEKSEERKI